MGSVLPIRKPVPQPVSLQSQAMDNLSFIRSAMETAGPFTGVSGEGGMVMGVTALIAAFLAHASESPRVWLAIWTAEACVAFAIAFSFCARKAVRSGTVLLSRPFRRFVLAMAPSVAAGGVLTVVFERSTGNRFLPALWLLLYGAGIASGGAFSVRIVPLMGICFMLTGALAAAAPALWADGLMACGFGGLHLAFGAVIARKYRG